MNIDKTHINLNKMLYEYEQMEFLLKVMLLFFGIFYVCVFVCLRVCACLRVCIFFCVFFSKPIFER